MESPGRRRESTVARWLLVVTRGRCVLKNGSGGRPLVLEARNEALRLVDDQSVAVAGAAEARLFGPHRHGARARVLWARAPALTFAQPRAGDRGPFWTSWPGRKCTDSHKPHPAFACRLLWSRVRVGLQVNPSYTWGWCQRCPFRGRLHRDI
jgi:hypothetical protein